VKLSHRTEQTTKGTITKDTKVHEGKRFSAGGFGLTDFRRAR